MARHTSETCERVKSLNLNFYSSIFIPVDAERLAFFVSTKTHMSKLKTLRPQKYFGKHREPLVKMPNLVESQLASFRQFVEGSAERVFKEFSPINDHAGKKFELKLTKFTFGDVRWDEHYAKRSMRTFEAPLSANCRKDASWLSTRFGIFTSGSRCLPKYFCGRVDFVFDMYFFDQRKAGRTASTIMKINE